jgi:hypothetical protein
LSSGGYGKADGWLNKSRKYKKRKWRILHIIGRIFYGSDTLWCGAQTKR